MRFFIFFIFFIGISNGAQMVESVWQKGDTFLTFLERNSIPLSLYYSLDKEDKELAGEIFAGIKYQILIDDNGDMEQVLIPVGDELQIHIYKDVDSKYVFTTTPISYFERKHTLSISIKTSPYQDILNATNNYLLANEFSNAFKNSVNFRQLREGDRLVVVYTQRERLGRQYGIPVIESAMVELRGKQNFIFKYNSNRYYNQLGQELEGFFLTVPLKYKRISSPFTTKRWHPVLKRYRAHLGIDYAAPTGTLVNAAGDGKISFVGEKGGYGKTVIIKHQNGYETLYAHLNGFKKGLKSGQNVKKNQQIAYVGNTGVSTGPHLHFGLYKNGQAINPASVVKITKSTLEGKQKKEFYDVVKLNKEKIEHALKNPAEPYEEQNFDFFVPLLNDA